MCTVSPQLLCPHQPACTQYPSLNLSDPTELLHTSVGLGLRALAVSLLPLRGDKNVLQERVPVLVPNLLF